MSIASQVKVSASYTRSVNLERDSQSDSLDLGYIPTSKALRTLATISSRFSETDLPRAWSLVGPYGSGKSSFALFLSHLLADPSLKKTKVAQKVLKKTDPELEASLRAETKGTQGYVEVLISETPERLSMRYLRGLQEAMTDYWQGRKGKKPSVLAEKVKQGSTMAKDEIDKLRESYENLDRRTQWIMRGMGILLGIDLMAIL